MHSWVDGACTCRGSDCSKAKHPRNHNGFLGATLDEGIIRNWWSKWPDANVAIATGSGLFVLDVDPDKGGDESLAAWEAQHGKLPPTVEAVTGGGGRHLYFATTLGLQSKVGVAPGLDVRCEGGYVVAAPSSHESGRFYSWEILGHPDDVPIAPVPEWLAARAGERRTRESTPPDGGADRYVQGGRNQAMTSLGGSMRRRGFGVEEIEAALLISNQKRCTPPLDEAEISKIARSVARYESTTAPRGVPPGATGPEGATAPPGPGASSILQRGDHVELAEQVLRKLENEGPLTHDEGDVWCYDAARGVWDRVSPETISGMVLDFAGFPVATKTDPRPLKLRDTDVRGVSKLVVVLLQRVAERPRFAGARRGVAFKNGFVVVENGTVSVLPHAPGHMGRHAFPFDYDPSAPNARLREFFAELFADVTDAESAARESMLAEFVGASLVGEAPSRQRVLLLVGGGGNGKSAFLKLARAVFPPGSCASVPPQKWGERFQSVGLVGALANFCDEIPEHDITSGATFKGIVSGDKIWTERKGKDAFEFIPRAGHIFSCNTLPGTTDHSEGFFRRFVICPFTRDFEKAPTRRLDAAASVIESELPALVAWALGGVAALQRIGGYSESDTAMATRKEWRRESDPVLLWITSRDWGPGAVAASHLFAIWNIWATENRFRPITVSTFGRRLMASGLVARQRSAIGSSYVRLQINGGL